jgi:hypothetical protein
MILEFIDSFHWPFSVFLIAAAFILLTAGGILFVRNTTGLKHLKDSHDVTGIIFANLGVLYAVLLGFTIVNAQARFDKIKTSTQIEGAHFIDLYRDAELFSHKEQQHIKKAIAEYVKSVIDHEWGELRPHPDTEQKFKTLLRCYYDVNVKTSKQYIWYTESVRQLNELGDLRLTRILGSQESIGSALWTILILGGISMVVFLCFLGPNKPIQHLFMASILAFTIAFCLFLVHSLDSAFTGSISIKSEEFQNLLQILEQDLH